MFLVFCEFRIKVLFLVIKPKTILLCHLKCDKKIKVNLFSLRTGLWNITWSSMNRGQWAFKEVFHLNGLCIFVSSLLFFFHWDLYISQSVWTKFRHSTLKIFKLITYSQHVWIFNWPKIKTLHLAGKVFRKHFKNIIKRIKY